MTNKGIINETDFQKVLTAFGYAVIRTAGSGSGPLDSCDLVAVIGGKNYCFELKKENSTRIYVSREQHEQFLRFGKRFQANQIYYVVRFRKNNLPKSPRYTGYWFINAYKVAFTPNHNISLNYSHLSKGKEQKIHAEISIHKEIPSDLKNPSDLFSSLERKGFHNLESLLNNGKHFELSGFEKLLSLFKEYLSKT